MTHSLVKYALPFGRPLLEVMLAIVVRYQESALGSLGSIQFLDVDEVQDLDRCRCTVVFKLSCDYLARSSKSRSSTSSCGTDSITLF